MATAIVKDYLGHPCQVTAALERFEDPLGKARKVASKEPREVVRTIGRLLHTLQDRIDASQTALEACQKVLENSTDTDEARAIIVMADEYNIETSNRFYELAGYVLAALEHGGLHTTRKASHG